MPWNYIDVIVDTASSSAVGDFKCGPGEYPTKEDASAAFHQDLNRLYKRYRGTSYSGNLKNLRTAWSRRQGNVARSNNVVLAVYEHPPGRSYAHGVMLSMLVNQLCRVNRLGLLGGHVSFWAIGELMKNYPDIRRLCAKLDTSH